MVVVWMVNLRRLLQIASLSFVLLAISTSCTRSAAPVEAAPAPPATPPAVANSSAPAAGTYTASGPIVVENQVEVAAQRDGVVVEILAEAGTHVRKGQLLAKLDDRQIVADLEAARAKSASIEADLNNWKAEAKVLEADLQRARKMWEAQLIPQEQYEHAQYKAEADQWDVKRVEHLLVNARDTEQSLELELEKTRITAPFDGIVARRYVRVGQTVTRGDRLVWVTSTGPLRVRFTLPSRFLSQMKVGQRLSLSVPDENPAVERAAHVIQVSPVVDPGSDTIEVLAELSDAVQGIRPGMQADVHVPALP